MSGPSGDLNGATTINGNLTKPRFVPVEVDRFTWTVPDRYNKFRCIGNGAFGIVCSAYDTKLQRLVAVKKLTKPFEDSEYAKRTYREIRILAHVNHENIICLMDVFSPQTSVENFAELYLVTPLMGADLGTVIRTQELSDSHVRFLVYQIMRALKYMHSCGLVHRDLKPVNIAVNEDCELKILDFGLARQRQDEMSGYVATRWYRAPEILLNWMHYGEAVDIWSVGCIMVELRTRTTLFAGKNHIDHLRRVMKLLGKPDREFMNKIKTESARNFLESIQDDGPTDLRAHFSMFPEDGVDLLEKMLYMDPDRRYTATQALAHPYFQTYHDEADEPVGERFEDPLESRSGVTLTEWKNHVWSLLENFTPNLDSLRTNGKDD